MRSSITIFLLTAGLAATTIVHTSDPQPAQPPPHRSHPWTFENRVEKRSVRTTGEPLLTRPDCSPLCRGGILRIEKRSAGSLDSLVATTRRTGGIAVTLPKRPLAFDALAPEDAKAESKPEDLTDLGGSHFPYIGTKIPANPEPAAENPTTTPSNLDREESITRVTTAQPAPGPQPAIWTRAPPQTDPLPATVSISAVQPAEPVPPARAATPDDEPKLVIATDLPHAPAIVPSAPGPAPVPPSVPIKDIWYPTPAQAPVPSIVPKPVPAPGPVPDSRLDVSSSIAYGHGVPKTDGKSPVPVPKPALDESNQAVSTLRNFEQEARAFYGKALNHLKKGEFGEAFDLFAAKLEHAFPGMLSKELLAKLRASQNISEDKRAELQAEVKQQAQAYITRKAITLFLNPEASGFLLAASTTFENKSNPNTPVLRPYLPAFVSARKQFDALSLSAKQALIKAFPHLGMLDEMEAYIKVFDDLVVHLKGFCENLPGFEECDQLRALY